MLVGGGMEHHLGVPAAEGLLKPGRVADVAELQGEALVGELGPQGTLTAPEAVLAAAQKNDAAGPEGGHLASQLAPDGAAATRDEHHGILKDQLQRALVQDHGLPAEEVIDGNVLQLGFPAAVPQQVVDARDSLDGGSCGTSSV